MGLPCVTGAQPGQRLRAGSWLWSEGICSIAGCVKQWLPFYSWKKGSGQMASCQAGTPLEPSQSHCAGLVPTRVRAGTLPACHGSARSRDPLGSNALTHTPAVVEGELRSYPNTHSFSYPKSLYSYELSQNCARDREYIFLPYGVTPWPGPPHHPGFCSVSLAKLPASTPTPPADNSTPRKISPSQI